MIQVGNEPDGFRIGHGAGKGLREISNSWKLDDPRFFVVIRTEILRVVLEGFLQRLHHPRHIPRMVLVVIHLELHAIPLFALHLVTGRHERDEVKRRMVKLVVKISPSVLAPLSHQRSRRNRNLVGRGADHGLQVRPIRVAPAIVVHAIIGAIALQRPHQYLLTQTIFATIVRISQFAPGVVTNSRSDCVVEEGAVLRDLHIADGVFESAIPALDGKDCSPRFARLERGCEVVNAIRQPGIVLGQRRAGNLDVGVIPPVNGIMDFSQRLRIRVIKFFLHAHRHVAGLREDIHPVFIDAADARLRQPVELLIIFLVIRLQRQLIIGSHQSVQDFGIVKNPAPGRGEQHEAD